MSAEDGVSRQEGSLEDLVGGFDRPDAIERIEALAGMEPLSLGILTRSIRFPDLQRPSFGSRKGRRRFGP